MSEKQENELWKKTAEFIAKLIIKHVNIIVY